MRERDPNPVTRAQKAKTISEIAFRTLVALIVAGMVAAVLVLVVRQDANSRAVQILIDCTTPQHQCYKRETKATSDAVATLNRVTILASSCAATLPNPTPANVKRCVIAHLR